MSILVSQAEFKHILTGDETEILCSYWSFPEPRENQYFSLKVVTTIEHCLCAKSLSIICTLSHLLRNNRFYDSHFSDEAHGLSLTMKFEFAYFWSFSKVLYCIPIQKYSCQDLAQWASIELSDPWGREIRMDNNILDKNTNFLNPFCGWK